MEPDAEYARRLPNDGAAGAPRGAACDAASAAAQPQIIPCQGLGAADAQAPPPDDAAPAGAACAGAAARGGACGGDAAGACRGAGSGAAVTAQAARFAACGARGPAAAVAGTSGAAGSGERDGAWVCAGRAAESAALGGPQLAGAVSTRRCGSGGAPAAAEPSGKGAAAAPRPVISLHARAGGADSAGARARQAPAPAAPAESARPAVPGRTGSGRAGERPNGCCCGAACDGSMQAAAGAKGCGRGTAAGLGGERAGPAKARGPAKPAAHAPSPHAGLGRVAIDAQCMTSSCGVQACMLVIVQRMCTDARVQWSMQDQCRIKER